MYTLPVLFFLSVSIFQTSYSQIAKQNKQTYKNKVQMSEDEWKTKLTKEQFQVLRLKGTESVFSGKYYKHNDKGDYTCAGCGNVLFLSDTKYNSGSGWPSFFDAVKGSIIFSTDYKLGYARTEICCSKCEGHLGHVFEDGPKPTGMRYCVNSVSLDFKKK
jgi:peptide-methionine (R)-S-oxide reductase